MEKYTITVGQLIDSLRKEANDNLDMVVYVEDEHEGCLFGPKVIVDWLGNLQARIQTTSGRSI